MLTPVQLQIIREIALAGEVVCLWRFAQDLDLDYSYAYLCIRKMEIDGLLSVKKEANRLHISCACNIAREMGSVL